MLTEKVVFPAVAARDLERVKAWHKDKLGLSPSKEIPDV